MYIDTIIVLWMFTLTSNKFMLPIITLETSDDMYYNIAVHDIYIIHVFLLIFIYLFTNYAYINEGCIYVVILTVSRFTERLQYNTIIIIYKKITYPATHA